jgi:hypothetical protein
MMSCYICFECFVFVAVVVAHGAVYWRGVWGQCVVRGAWCGGWMVWKLETCCPGITRLLCGGTRMVRLLDLSGWYSPCGCSKIKVSQVLPPGSNVYKSFVDHR